MGCTASSRLQGLPTSSARETPQISTSPSETYSSRPERASATKKPSVTESRRRRTRSTSWVAATVAGILPHRLPHRDHGTRGVVVYGRHQDPTAAPAAPLSGQLQRELGPFVVPGQRGTHGPGQGMGAGVAGTLQRGGQVVTHRQRPAGQRCDGRGRRGPGPVGNPDPPGAIHDARGVGKAAPGGQRERRVGHGSARMEAILVTNMSTATRLNPPSGTMRSA